MKSWEKNWVLIFPICMALIAITAFILPHLSISHNAPAKTPSALSIYSSYELAGMYIITPDKKVIRSPNHGNYDCVVRSECRAVNPAPGMYEVHMSGVSKRATDSVFVVYTKKGNETAKIERQLSFDAHRNVSFSFELRNDTLAFK